MAIVWVKRTESEYNLNSRNFIGSVKGVKKTLLKSNSM